MVSWYLTQHSPNALQPQLKQQRTQTRVHVTKAVIGTHHKIGGEVPDIRFLSNHTRKQMKVMKEKERGPHNHQIHH